MWRGVDNLDSESPYNDEGATTKSEPMTDTGNDTQERAERFDTEIESTMGRIFRLGERLRKLANPAKFQYSQENINAIQTALKREIESVGLTLRDTLSRDIAVNLDREGDDPEHPVNAFAQQAEELTAGVQTQIEQIKRKANLKRYAYSEHHVAAIMSVLSEEFEETIEALRRPLRRAGGFRIKDRVIDEAAKHSAAEAEAETHEEEQTGIDGEEELDRTDPDPQC